MNSTLCGTCHAATFVETMDEAREVGPRAPGATEAVRVQGTRMMPLTRAPANDSRTRRMLAPSPDSAAFHFDVEPSDRTSGRSPRLLEVS